MGTVDIACWHDGFELEIFLCRPGKYFYSNCVVACLGMCDDFWVPLIRKHRMGSDVEMKMGRDWILGAGAPLLLNDGIEIEK